MPTPTPPSHTQQQQQHCYFSSSNGPFQGHTYSPSSNGPFQGHNYSSSSNGPFQGHTYSCSSNGPFQGHTFPFQGPIGPMSPDVQAVATEVSRPVQATRQTVVKSTLNGAQPSTARCFSATLTEVFP